MRRTIAGLTGLLSCGLLFGGCEPSSIGSMKTFSKAACACADKACARAVAKSFDPVEVEYLTQRRSLGDAAKEDLGKSFKALQAEANACLEPYGTSAR